MSKLSVGIVGLPNVGKSTLFNALLRKQQAYAANFPFATIDPNVGVVPVPDERLGKLADVIASGHSGGIPPATPGESIIGESLHRPPIVPATVEFVDIAGLIAGAHKGEGLGNKFLHHIREVDAICHVVRAFKDENIIKEGSVNPKADFETIKTELDLADLESIEKREVKKNKKFPPAGGEELPLFKNKPILVVLNVDEDDLKNAEKIESDFSKEIGVDRDQVIAICAKLEEELAVLQSNEAAVYLNEVGVAETGLTRLIKKAFKTLGLMTFLTAGEKEVRAWTIKEGTLAPKAASAIHTDFEKKFIKADVVSFEEFVDLGGWKNCREKGKVRTEGRDYVVKDGDVIEFKTGA